MARARARARAGVTLNPTPNPNPPLLQLCLGPAELGQHRRQRLGHLLPPLLRALPPDRSMLRPQAAHLRRVTPFCRCERAARLVEHQTHVAQLHVDRVDQLALHRRVPHVNLAREMTHLAREVLAVLRQQRAQLGELAPLWGGKQLAPRRRLRAARFCPCGVA